MPMTLYCLEGSPPVRAVYLCLEALGLKPERKHLDLFKGDHLTPEYTKINPQHTVPTLDDNGFIIWDSHVINAYLASKYGKDDSLYPKDLEKRAIVDQRLHFDSGFLFPRLLEITFPLFFLKSKQIPEEKRKRIVEGYEHLEKFLEGRAYIAANHYTIADFCLVSTVTSLEEGLGISTEGHPRVQAWIKLCKKNLPGYSQAQERGLAILKELVQSNLK